VKHNRKVLLASLIVCLIVTTAVAGCGGAKAGGKSQVYTASFGKIKVTLTVPAETNPTSSVIEKADRYFTSALDAAISPHVLASYTVQNGSSRATHCDNYAFNLTLKDGQRAQFENVTKELENALQGLENQPDRVLLGQGKSVLSSLLVANKVKQGHSGTAYGYFYALSNQFEVGRVTVTSKEAHETKSMMKL